MPGDRVKVFDHRLFVDDIKTPLFMTMQPATVVRRYGIPDKKYPICGISLGPYPDVVDVVFDREPDRESKGHFTNGVEILEVTERCVN
jgi:hypothetical protein